jgi:hypothetical protein
VDEQALIDRLGLPEVYAGELRAAAGFEATYAPPTTKRPSLNDRLNAWGDALRERLWSPQTRDAMPYAQVGWWVVRGWLLGYTLSMIFTTKETMSPLPDLRTDGGWMGLAVLAGSIAMSIGFGVTMRKHRGSRRWWLLLVPVNLVALLGLMVVAFGDRPYYEPNSGGVDAFAEASEPIMGSMVGPRGTDVSNIYAFDRAGKPIKEVFLFDQDGNPLELVRESCSADGELRTDNQFPRPQLRYDANGECVEDAAIPFTALIKPQAPSMTLTKPESPESAQ